VSADGSALPPTPDRLSEIKARYAKVIDNRYEGGSVYLQDISWLVSEVERLRGSPAIPPADNPYRHVEYESHRRVWHVDDRYPMKMLSDELEIEDGSKLQLYECTHCQFRAFAGLDSKRRIIVRSGGSGGAATP
jgi:hypothetical protein